MSDENKEYDIILNGPYFSYGSICEIYGIKTVDDAVKWALENDTEPENSIRRVLNYSLHEYGRDFSSITNNVISYYFALSSENWYKLFSKRITDNKTIIIEASNTDDLENILKKKITKEFILDCFKTFYKNYIMGKKDSYPTHDDLKEYIYEKLLESMNIKIL